MKAFHNKFIYETQNLCSRSSEDVIFFFLSQIAKYKYFAGYGKNVLNTQAFLVIHALAATRGYLQHTFLTALQHGCQVLKKTDTKHPKKTTSDRQS